MKDFATGRQIGILMVGNDYIAKIQRMNPKRIIGLATINPWNQRPKTYNYPPEGEGRPMDLPIRDEALEELDRCILDLGLNGLKMHPLEHNYEINNPTVVYPVLQRLTELQEKTGRKMLVVVHAAGDSVNNTATAMAETAKAFPVYYSWQRMQDLSGVMERPARYQSRCLI